MLLHVLQSHQQPLETLLFACSFPPFCISHSYYILLSLPLRYEHRISIICSTQLDGNKHTFLLQYIFLRHELAFADTFFYILISNESTNREIFLSVAS